MTLWQRWTTVNRHFFILGGIISIPAIACFIYSGGLAFSTWLFVRAAVRTEGTIVEFQEAPSAARTTYTPVFSFTDNAGVERKAASQISAVSRIHRIGDKVPILYSPGPPLRAELDEFFPLWGQAATFATFGGFFFIPGGLLLIIGLFLRR